MKHFDRVGIYEYPDKYVIVTINTWEQGGGMQTDQISVTSKDIDNLELSELILKHLALSKSGVNYFDREKAKKELIKVTGLKTLKAQMTNSKYISVNRNNGIYSIGPTVNGGTSGPKKGYHFTKEKIEFNEPEKITEIGINVKKGLELSK
ncbi:hypothetical protein NO995_10220 [Aestuariibaculum sp. M13]|uniref:hypothetical protein n=1 Tax=Aestuariibaculum sp. M13 TaxID=2967132 RepID=UPI002159C850|nr:hypothetical protein [Aestuariibaculum sp. M13]MCR8668058.1 hypothetical protein [Aestuariibaculum sp. M13]